MNHICEQESICYALILLSLICCIHSATIIHRFSRECKKGNDKYRKTAVAGKHWNVQETQEN